MDFVICSLDLAKMFITFVCITFNPPSYSVAQVASTASLVSSPTINTPTTLTVNTVMPLTSTSVSSLSFTGVCVTCVFALMTVCI